MSNTNTPEFLNHHKKDAINFVNHVLTKEGKIIASLLNNIVIMPGQIIVPAQKKEIVEFFRPTTDAKYSGIAAVDYELDKKIFRYTPEMLDHLDKLHQLCDVLIAPPCVGYALENSDVVCDFPRIRLYLNY